MYGNGMALTIEDATELCVLVANHQAGIFASRQVDVGRQHTRNIRSAFYGIGKGFHISRRSNLHHWRRKRAAQLADLFIGKRRFPECHFGNIVLCQLAVLVAEQIEAEGLNLKAVIVVGVSCGKFLSIHIEDVLAVAIAQHYSIPFAILDGAEVATHGVYAYLVGMEEEVAVVAVVLSSL